MKKNVILILIFLLSINLGLSANLPGIFTNVYVFSGSKGTVYNYYGNNNIIVDIIIPNNVILALKCGIYKISAGKKITVEPGGQLILENATLTQTLDNSAGNSTLLSGLNNWLGIEILGSDSDPQQDVGCITSACNGAPQAVQYNDGPHYNNGVMLSYKSKIRYSDYGVTMGTIHKGSHYAGGGGGGTLYANECKFENNKWRHICFLGDFTTSGLNHSIIKYNTFMYDDHCYPDMEYFKHVHQDLIFWGVSFKYNIDHNVFRAYSIFNKFYGAYLSNSFVRFSKNTFQNHMVGIMIDNAQGFKNYEVIHDNFFNECQLGIDNASGSRVRIQNNIFKSCSFTRYTDNTNTLFDSYFSPSYPIGFSSVVDATVCIYNGNFAPGFICSGNKFTRSGGPRGQSDAAIVNWTTGSLASIFYKDTSVRMLTGFRSFNDNRGFQIQCCNFSSSVKNDIVNDNGFSFPTMSNQSPLTTTGNVHTKRSPAFDINNQSSFSFKYNFKTSSGPQTPINVANTNLFGKFTNNICSAKTYNTEELGCGKLTTYVAPGLTAYTQIKDSINDVKAGGITEEEILTSLTQSYDLMMGEIIDGFITNSLRDSINNQDSIKNFLMAHNTLNSKVYLVDWYLSNDSFVQAQDLLDTLDTNYPSDKMVKDFVEYNVLAVSRLQSDSNNVWLFSHYNDFKMIADSGGYMSRRALRDVQLIAFFDTTNADFDSIINYAYLPNISDTLSTDTIGEIITVAPVPFTNSLTVTIHNLKTTARTFNIVLKNLDGTEMFSHSLMVNPIDTDYLTDTSVTGLADDYYILQVFESGYLIDARLIVK